MLLKLEMILIQLIDPISIYCQTICAGASRDVLWNQINQL